MIVKPCKLLTDREKLIELLSSYFDIGDSYAYNLTRVKSAFAVGTMSLEDFEEFDDDTVADIAEYLLSHGVTFEKQGRWKRTPSGNGWNDWDDLRCSVCGKYFRNPSFSENYCPNCGAKMDGGESDGK